MEHSPSEVTQLLADLEASKLYAAPKLFELLYSELRRLAQYHLRNERVDHSLQATALVHEAYLRLVGVNRDWRDRAHFFAVASSAMRRVLVDHARAKHAAKRPSSQQKVDLDSAPLFSEEAYDDVIALDRALDRLEKIDPRQVRIVELRYFGGLTAEETAEALGVSATTVLRDWIVAKTWLHAELVAKSPAP